MTLCGSGAHGLQKHMVIRYRPFCYIAAAKFNKLRSSLWKLYVDWSSLNGRFRIFCDDWFALGAHHCRCLNLNSFNDGFLSCLLINRPLLEQASWSDHFILLSPLFRWKYVIIINSCKAKSLFHVGLQKSSSVVSDTVEVTIKSAFRVTEYSVFLNIVLINEIGLKRSRFSFASFRDLQRKLNSPPIKKRYGI